MNERIFNELKENDSKFIQVYLSGRPYLVFAPKKDNCYHGFILEEFLKKFEIEFETFRDKCLFSEIPLIEDLDSDYKLVGAGKVSRLYNGDLEFYDSSGSYHVGTNPKHLEEIFEDDNPTIEKINNFRYVVRFNCIKEDKNSEIGIKLKSNLYNSSDEAPF